LKNTLDSGRSVQWNLAEAGREQPAVMYPLIFVLLFIKKFSHQDGVIDGLTKKSWEELRQTRNKLKEVSAILSEVEDLNGRLGSISKVLQRDVLRMLNANSEIDRLVDLIDSVDTTDQISLTELIKLLLISYDNSVGIKGGFGFTPVSLKLIAAKYFDTKKSTIYDPCLGLAGFSEFDPAQVKKVYGQEINEFVAILARIVHSLLGFRDCEIDVTNSFFNPPKNANGGLMKFDLAFCDPPFGISFSQIDRENFGFETETYKSGVTGDSNWMFAQRVLSSLKEEGEGIVLVSLGSLSTQLGYNVRKDFVANKYIKAVVQLPMQLRTNTSIHSGFLVLSKTKNEAGILFVKADSIGAIKGGVRSLSESEVDKIVRALKTGEESEGFSKFVGYKEVEGSDFNLLPQRYVQSVKKISILPVQDLIANVEHAKKTAESSAKTFFKLLGELEKQ
jgi:type I restriction-modification system DNA methylase subunit